MKIWWALALGACCCALSGCQFIPGTDAYKIKGAETNAAENLIDPSSAQFRNVQFHDKAGLICGEINAKNRMGAYVGYARFVSFTRFKLVFVATETTQSDVDHAFCPESGGECRDRQEKIDQLVSQQMLERNWKESCV